MTAFNHAQCPKCKHRFGWQGEALDCPPCPKCGNEIPLEELGELQRQIDDARAEMRAKLGVGVSEVRIGDRVLERSDLTDEDMQNDITYPSGA